MITKEEFLKEKSAKVLIDTNMIITPAELGIDIYDEIFKKSEMPLKLYIVDKTLYELDMLIVNRKGKIKNNVKLAKKILESKNLIIIETEKIEENEDVDDIILNIAKEANKSNLCFIATSDKELRKNAISDGIPLVSLRKKQYIIFERK